MKDIRRAIRTLVTTGLFAASTFAHAQTQEPTEVPADLGPLDAIVENLDELQQMQDILSQLPPLPSDAVLDELDAITRAQVDDLLNNQLFDLMQQNALTNGELADQVEALLRQVDLQPVIDGVQGIIPANLPLGLHALLTPLLDGAQSGVNFATLLVDFAIFRFVTESDGVKRTHLGILNVPMPLDVDSRLGPDVVATFSIVPLQGGSFTIQMKVTRPLQPLGGLPLLGSVVARDLPLDIRTQIDIPLAAFTGSDDPTMRIELGFASNSNMPTSTSLALPVNLNLIGGGSPELAVEWSTQGSDADLALVLDVKQQNPLTGEFDKQVGLALANSPVVESFALGLVAGPATTQFSARASRDTTLSLNLDIPHTAQVGVTIDQLPRQIDATLGAGEISYLAGAAIANLLVDVDLAQGLAMNAALRDLPDAIAIDFAGLTGGDGSEIAIDFDDQSIGAIEFTLSDGPDAGDLLAGLEDANGLLADLTEGLKIGARLEGFSGLQASLGDPLSLGVQIRTALPFLLDAAIAPDTGARIAVRTALSNIPDDIGVSLEFGNLIDASFFASAPVDLITLDALLDRKTITATLQPLPAEMRLCATQDSNRCTGRTPGTLIDAGFTASERLNFTAEACLEESGCLLGRGDALSVPKLSFQTFEVSGHTRDTKLAGVTIPHGAGQFAINTDAQQVEATVFGRFSNIQLIFDFLGAALNLDLRYNAGTPTNLVTQSGGISCTKFDLNVAVGNLIVIQNGKLAFLDLKKIFCGS
jgi:hypothetical protein